MYIRKIFASNNITRVANGLTVCNINSDEKEFTEPFISLNDLMFDLQNRMNESADLMASSPDELVRTNAASDWTLLHKLFDDLVKV